ncbi:hypothetical protein A2U01_0011728 [Trifolium medium]|uniref:Uncharacterized protein n=1 Tax=Trifolium medium TaxID=97028 RepID=A0A392MUU9_9FABA|nr:hypothetical protein [Trifolium medium]
MLAKRADAAPSERVRQISLELALCRFDTTFEGSDPQVDLVAAKE